MFYLLFNNDIIKFYLLIKIKKATHNIINIKYKIKT